MCVCVFALVLTECPSYTHLFAARLCVLQFLSSVPPKPSFTAIRQHQPLCEVNLGLSNVQKAMKNQQLVH